MHFLRSALLVSVVAAAIGISGAVLLHGVMPSQAVQNPAISFDMVTTGNAYDGATNSMSVGAIDQCVDDTSPTFPHNRTAHLIVQNVEDLAGAQVRINHEDTRVEVTNILWAPFQDPNTLAPIGFLNLPIDPATLDHRGLTGASDFTQVNTSLASQSYLGEQDAPTSPDTPAKSVPDDTSYDAPTGGILANVVMQVKAGANGNPSNFLNLDDGNPNAPGSSVDIYTGTGINKVPLASSQMGDGYVGVGTTCAPLDCVSVECPPVIDVRNHTFVNDTPLAASDLHIRFSDAVTPRLVQNAPGCPPPTIGGDHAAGRVDVNWGALCVDSTESVMIEITSWPPATADCAHWGILGVATTVKTCDLPPAP